MAVVISTFAMGGSVVKRNLGISIMIKEIIIIFLTAMAALLIARVVALKCGLVDKPGGRKQHKGEIPLVGGISFYCVIAMCYLFSPEVLPHTEAHFLTYLLSVSLLLFVGIADDRFDLPVAPRVVIQALSAVILMVDGLYLHTFGHLLGEQELQLGPVGYLATLFATWAAINAFNMIDGVDGLLGSVSCVIFAALMVVFLLAGTEIRAMWCLLMIVALIPYLMFNMGFIGGKRLKVFMGDAGSMVIGFTVLWLVMLGSQGNDAVMAPVTALWLIALPLMDMVTIMVRRLRRGQSPFHPDRDHLHHILIRSGLTARQTVLFASVLTATLACVGMVLSIIGITEWLSLALFIGVFASYFAINNKLQQRHPDMRSQLTSSRAVSAEAPVSNR
ncbi:undecaprenyl-phosphate N-acetylglucosaminyl 1-phosphate transferase [Buttiauxella brennerae ATCC 51605]|uniref:Undecaprenyl-phosphate alpha-N-acetylglucosaminyl 1-phosphate transferase n=1 Tax=Buttiauxella brennerae ATCC 51605 TaxID=1354251 RepID=A0A1B7IHP8_9ENTR|nr:UDP-N-acetylglucosamine--undecaprenyl-phosphate N-acetylglucosaminephosphotransferase [Buttiauxella brennerae]OAT28952.1 undecaprenyl-phosphate N-acetylglucosaminyl 1-phosphate transferase [Buttiauxella brennerae ATCC 51605]